MKIYKKLPIEKVLILIKNDRFWHLQSHSTDLLSVGKAMPFIWFSVQILARPTFKAIYSYLYKS